MGGFALPQPQQPTGNPLLDNPALKAQVIAGMQQRQQSPIQAAVMPSGSAPPPVAPVSLPDAKPAMPSAEKKPMVFGPFGQSATPMAQRGTQEGDQQERERLEGSGSGISQIAKRIESSGFGQNHPVLGKIAGIGAQGLATLGDIGLNLTGAGRSIEPLIPGTEGHHQLDLRRANNALTGDITNQEKEAQTANVQSQVPLHQAMTEHEQAETEGLKNPQVKPKEESWKELAGYTGPNGEPLEIEQNSGQVRPAQVPGAKQTEKPTKESNPQQQTYDSLIKSGLSPIQAYEKIREKPGGTVINQGTWALDEDPTTGKPVLFNSKTGETKEAPAGVAKAGTFAKSQAATAPAEQALKYATEYGDRTLHTGPGDEALMEKFFELAKPSTGFRMSQPQIDMLKNAQSWMSGLEAHLRHATTGTWFSDEQRQQIIGTMKDLGNAKGIGEKPAGGAGASGGTTQKFTDNGTVYNIPPDQVAEFKKDHPNAR